MKTVNFSVLNHLRENGGFISAQWHGSLLLPMYHYRDQKLVSFSSPAWDGMAFAEVLLGLGYELIYASDSYNTMEGFRKSLRALRDGKSISMIIDGPEGPRHEVKPGIILMAAKSGKPILPVYATVQKKLIVPSWDKFEIPIPFTRGELRVGKPLYIPRKVNADELEVWQTRLRDEMKRIEKKTCRDLQIPFHG